MNDLNTQLLNAAKDGDTSRCLELLTLGADVEASRVSSSILFGPLHAAASHGHVLTCQALLERGADINARTTYGNTPLHQAVTHSQIPICALLLEQGCDHQIRNNHGWTALKLAIKGERRDCIATIRAGAAAQAARAALQEITAAKPS